MNDLDACAATMAAPDMMKGGGGPRLDRKVRPRVWQTTYLLNRDMIRDLRRLVSKHFPSEWDGRILDVGCGRQPYRGLFAGRCREYVGCDLYPDLNGVVACPADDLAFGDGEFEGVVCFQCIEHVPEPWEVVRECARVLAPGGRLLLTAPFVFPHHPSPTDFYRYTHEGLRHLAERAGLEVVEVVGSCASLPTICLLVNWYLWQVCAKLLSKPLTRPFGYLGRFVGVVGVNMLGVALGAVPLFRDFSKGNTGFSNYAVVCRKSPI